MKQLLILTILTVFIMSSLAYGYIEANWSCLFFNQCENTENTRASISLGQVVSEAGVFYLKAGRDYQNFLQYIEYSEYNSVDNINIIGALDDALKSMEAANSRYYDAWKISLGYKSDPRVSDMLAGFNYFAFQKRYKLIPGLFDLVEKYLSNGNVSGIYKKAYNDTGVLIQKITLLKESFVGNSVDFSLCWEINQQLLKNLLFGQYVSQVFAEINKRFK